MTVVLIWVGDSTDPNYNNKLMKMPSLFFRAEVPIEQSSLMLHTDYGFPPDVLSKEAHMKSWALDIENEGFQCGIKQGRGEGLELGIVQGLARTIKRMMAKMGSSLEDTMAYLQLTDDEKSPRALALIPKAPPRLSHLKPIRWGRVTLTFPNSP